MLHFTPCISSFINLKIQSFDIPYGFKIQFIYCRVKPEDTMKFLKTAKTEIRPKAIKVSISLSLLYNTSWVPVLEQDMTMYEMTPFMVAFPCYLSSSLIHSLTHIGFSTTADIARSQYKWHKAHNPPLQHAVTIEMYILKTLYSKKNNNNNTMPYFIYNLTYILIDYIHIIEVDCGLCGYIIEFAVMTLRYSNH